MRFSNRRDAGEQLAARLLTWAKRSDGLVLALPRGGVPVGFEVAKRLCIPLDLMLVRKLGVPGQEEVAFGAVALPDICVFNEDVIRHCGITKQERARVIERERNELMRRNKAFRDDAPLPQIENHVVILVDDGMATGADMRAAVSAAKQQKPAAVIVGVPVGSQEACEALVKEADVLVCLLVPEFFFGVGQAYDDFTQTSNEEVCSLLKEAQWWDENDV